MKKENLVVTREEMKVVDGKVVISSEELAAAIQNYDIDLNCEEENQADDSYGVCVVIGKK